MQSSSSTVLPSVTVASASWEPVSWTCPSQMPHHMTHFDSEEQWLRDNLVLVQSPKASWSWLKSRPSAFAVIPMITGIQLLQLWWNRPHGWAFTHGAKQTQITITLKIVVFFWSDSTKGKTTCCNSSTSSVVGRLTKTTWGKEVCKYYHVWWGLTVTW